MEMHAKNDKINIMKCKMMKISYETGYHYFILQRLLQSYMKRGTCPTLFLRKNKIYKVIAKIPEICCSIYTLDFIYAEK